MPSLVVTNLIKRFGAVTAVDDVSFEVEPGQIFGLLGPNGAGKTTIISLIATILKPTALLAVWQTLSANFFKFMYF